MPKQIRTPLIVSPTGPEDVGSVTRRSAIERNIAQSFSDVARPDGASNGAPSARCTAPQVIDRAPPETRDSANLPAQTDPSGGPLDLPAPDDDSWQTHSDMSFSSEGYLPGKSPFDPPDAHADGTASPRRPPQLTDQQKVAIDMILQGKKLKAIAQRLEIHPGTLWRWRRHDLQFQRALSYASQKAIVQSIEQLRALVPKAVDILHSQLDNDQYNAAMQLLRLLQRDLDPYRPWAS